MRALVWRGVEEWLAEHAQVGLHDDGVLATGVQLGVEPEPYEHVRPGVVRYVSRGGDFMSELEVDSDGLVVRYPRLAERVGGQ